MGVARLFLSILEILLSLSQQMGKISNILQRLVATLMLLLFIEHIFSVTVFMHQHTIDGQTFTHSHIFSGTAESPQHTHTPQQINLIAALSVVKILVVAIALIGVILTAVGRRVVLYVIHIFKRRLRHVIPMRAPPVVALY